MNKNLKKCILSIIEETSKIPRINVGGCGVFAYELSKCLDKFNIKYKFCYCEDDYFSAKNCLDNDTVPNHIIIKIGYKYIDAKRFLSKKEFMYDYDYANTIETVNIDSNYIKYLIDNASWNWAYDRKNDLKIKKIIKTNFNKYIN